MTNDDNKINEKSFADGLNFFKMFWVFYIGCFAGVIVETLWCLATNGVLESRTALIFLPLNPVYGFGALVMSLCFVKFKKNNNVIIFAWCFLFGGVYEYICSLLQELAFGTVSWSYSADSLGIFERTSVVYCVFWGLLGLIWIRLIYPHLSNIIEMIPNKVGTVLTYFLLISLIIDMIFSAFAVYRQEQRRQGTPPTNYIQRFYDTNLNDDVLKRIYPNMKPVK